MPDDSRNIALVCSKVKFRATWNPMLKGLGEPTRLFAGVCLACILMSEWFADGTVDWMVSGNGTD